MEVAGGEVEVDSPVALANHHGAVDRFVAVAMELRDAVGVCQALDSFAVGRKWTLSMRLVGTKYQPSIGIGSLSGEAGNH